MDDLITGTNDIKQAFELYRNLKRIMKGADTIPLHITNSRSVILSRRAAQFEFHFLKLMPAVMKSVTEEEESFAKLASGSLNFASNENCSKLLGITWNNHSDEVLFNFSELIEYARNLPVTKRSVPKITAKIFDLLGFLIPFVQRYSFKICVLIKLFGMNYFMEGFLTNGTLYQHCLSHGIGISVG